jgi:hypothetical protein
LPRFRSRVCAIVFQPIGYPQFSTIHPVFHQSMRPPVHYRAPRFLTVFAATQRCDLGEAGCRGRLTALCLPEVRSSAPFMLGCFCHAG